LGAHVGTGGMSMKGTWTEEESCLSINILEIKLSFLACKPPVHLAGKCITNSTVVAYIRNQVEQATSPILLSSPLSDDNALGVDSLSASWEGLIAYPYPPTPLILAVLSKVASSHIRLCLIVSCWPNQACFQLLTDHPRRLPEWDRLLWHPIG
jgi:hypothetical protein